MKCLELRIPPLPSLLTVGHSVWRPGNRHFKRSFSVYDLIVVGNGTLFMREDEVEYPIGPEHMLLLEPDKVHEGYASCKEPTDVYWVHFSHGKALRTVEEDEIPWSLLLTKGTDWDLRPTEQTMFIPKYGPIAFGKVQPCLDRMVERQQSFSVEHALPLQAMLGELLAILQFSAHTRPRSRSREVSERTAEFLQRHWTEEFSRKRMEEALHFQFDYMTRCMRKEIGMTPLSYVQHLRLERSKMLLEQTTLTIQEIAEQIGLESGNYFGRWFREQSGFSPTQYRKRHQGKS